MKSRQKKFQLFVPNVKKRIISTFSSILILFTLLIAAFVQSTSADRNLSTLAIDPPSLNLNIVIEPNTIDPSLSSDTTSNSVINQLFLGLVDQDDESGDIKKEIATSWNISTDKTVYTFTLRDDVYWSDNTLLTAVDVRYGILRSLNPATGSDTAAVLDIILNAEDYRTGVITDPNQVGISAPNSTTLEITFKGSSILEVKAFVLSP